MARHRMSEFVWLKAQKVQFLHLQLQGKMQLSPKPTWEP